MNRFLLPHLLQKSVVLAGIALLSSCAQDYLGPPQVREYVPQYIDFTYKIDGKVQVRHSYLFGAGVKKCRYAGELATPYMEGGQALYPYKSTEMDNFFEKNGHIYQGGANRDNVVIGYPDISRLGGEIDPATGKQKIYVTELWSFDSLCSSHVGSSEYTIQLQKSSSLSIQDEIAQKKKLLGGAWKRFVRWDPESIIQRGNNKWIVFKTWNRADYLSDAGEYWYLPLGDGSYYYKVIFTYKSAMRERGDERYINSRAMFDRILDSFDVRTLTPEESAAIVNPEPIEPKEENMLDIDRKTRAERNLQRQLQNKDNK